MNEITRPIEVITQEINFYKLQAGNAIIEIGKRLHEAKLTLPHGAWGAWLQNDVEFSERTAQNFMRIAKEYRNPQLIADMGNSATKALLLLSLPAEEREEFVGEAHEIDGEEKTVAAMTTKEMERLLKELEAERAEKEKLQSQLDLFRTEKDNAVDAAYKETEDKLEALVNQKEAAEQAKREAEERECQSTGRRFGLGMYTRWKNFTPLEPSVKNTKEVGAKISPQRNRQKEICKSPERN